MISFYVLLTCKKNCANGNIVLLFKPLLIYLFIYLLTYLFIIEKGREEKERNINVREKRQLVASLMFLDQGQNLQPRHVSQLGTESLTFCFAGWHPINWAASITALFLFCFLIFTQWYVYWLERERNVNRLLSTDSPTGGWIHNPGMCPDWESNLQQDAAPTNCATWPGQTPTCS